MKNTQNTWEEKMFFFVAVLLLFQNNASNSKYMDVILRRQWSQSGRPSVKFE